MFSSLSVMSVLKKRFYLFCFWLIIFCVYNYKITEMEAILLQHNIAMPSRHILKISGVRCSFIIDLLRVYNQIGSLQLLDFWVNRWSGRTNCCAIQTGTAFFMIQRFYRQRGFWSFLLVGCCFVFVTDLELVLQHEICSKSKYE